MRRKVNNPCSFSITLPYDTAMHVRELCEEFEVSLTNFFLNASLARAAHLEKLRKDGYTGRRELDLESVIRSIPGHTESQLERARELDRERDLERVVERDMELVIEREFE